jgi:predicted adenine nucleotide alpha hydrolase (AANH) superfamily ATPase
VLDMFSCALVLYSNLEKRIKKLLVLCCAVGVGRVYAPVRSALETFIIVKPEWENDFRLQPNHDFCASFGTLLHTRHRMIDVQHQWLQKCKNRTETKSRHHRPFHSKRLSCLDGGAAIKEVCASSMEPLHAHSLFWITV